VQLNFRDSEALIGLFLIHVTSLDLRCQVCGANDGFALYIPFNRVEVDAFLRGDDMAHRRA